MLPRMRWLLLAVPLSMVATPATLHASDGDQVHIGRSITVSEGEQAGNLVCVGCSIQMEGTSQDVVAVGGSVMVNGRIQGDVVTVGGSVVLGENASVTGDVVTVAGRLSRHPNAVVSGEVTEQSGTFLLLGMFLIPLAPLVLIIALIIWLVRRNRRPMPYAPQTRP